MEKKKNNHLHAFACFPAFLPTLTPCLISVRVVCVWVSVKLCMCVLILVAATRSYSRSTGALHTPDAFGAAGEGWVHLFLRTSPTHSALIFIHSVLISFLSVPRVFSFILSAFFFFLVHQTLLFLFNILLQDVEASVELHASACLVASLKPCCQSYQSPFVYSFSSFPSAVGHQDVLLCFMSTIHCSFSDTCNVT